MITDSSMTFEELRIAKADDFPELAEGKKVSWTVEYGKMQKVISVFPLTQGIQLLKATFLGLTVDQMELPIIVMVCVTLVCSGIAVKCFKWE